MHLVGFIIRIYQDAARSPERQILGEVCLNRAFTGCNWGDQVRIEMGGACGTYGREGRLGSLRVSVGKRLCIGSLGRSKRRWENTS